jgi:Fe-S-cluster containining protein
LNTSSGDLPAIVAKAEQSADVALQMKQLYESADLFITDQKPTCWNHGDCCQFEKYGHRLYVTSIELAYFRQGHRDNWLTPNGSGSCPHQIGGRCMAREHRPLGCRIFFCDPNAQAWQGPLYERSIVELKRMGSALGIEYRYVEWLSALAEWESANEGRREESVDPAVRRMIELPVLK